MEAPYVVRFETYGDVVDPASYGADAAAEFFPHVPEALLEAARVAGLGRPGDFFLNYDAVAQQMTARREPGWVRYPAVVPGWDNTARRQERPALGLVGATPRRYERWLRDVLARQVNERPPGERIVFINAWNEWAESACLEPTATHGRAYLEATVAAVGLERPPEVSLARQLEGDFRDRCRRHIGWLGAADREMQRATGPLREQVALARLELARLEQALER